MHTTMKVATLVLALSLLGGCATVEVRYPGDRGRGLKFHLPFQPVTTITISNNTVYSVALEQNGRLIKKRLEPGQSYTGDVTVYTRARVELLYVAYAYDSSGNYVGQDSRRFYVRNGQYDASFWEIDRLRGPRTVR